MGASVSAAGTPSAAPAAIPVLGRVTSSVVSSDMISGE
jgi:hypothetical protein